MTATLQNATDQLLHVRFAGRSHELTLDDLGLKSDSPDAQIRAAVAACLDQPAGALDDHVVVRHERAIVVRPEAIYG